MKKILIALAAVVLAVSAPVFAQQLLDFQPGPRLIDGTQLNKMVDVVNTLTSNGTSDGPVVSGVAGAYALARGETALDGSNPTPATTGLTTITGCALTIKSTATPGVSTSVVTYDSSAGTLNMYGWRVTSSVNNTMVASTGTDIVGWVCVGTK